MSAFQPSSAATSDRLVNKVAMCGALFAGVAFVGYRIVKNAVKKNRNKSDPGNHHYSRMKMREKMQEISPCQAMKIMMLGDFLMNNIG